MGITRQLYQLQAIELDIESKEQTLAQSLAGLGESKVLLEARDRLSAGEKRLGELKKKQHNAEWEIEDVAGKLLSAQEALYSGRIANPKELSSLQHEVESFKNKRNSLEEKVLEIMEQAEVATSELARLKQQLGEVEKSWRQEQKQLSDAIEELKISLSGLKKEQQQELAGIDDETADCYRKLRQKKGKAVARVEQGICRGCGISLSTAELQRVKGNKIIMCNSCGRILFVD
ncbi:MAG: C4-type zinc ribbon domain-containing protein [Chloroflexota bacterium]